MGVEVEMDAFAEGLAEPVPRRTASMLRRAVHQHATDQPRRAAYPSVLHVGVPGADVASLELAAAALSDPGLRTDVVTALRVRAAPPDDHIVWLTRPGGLELQDLDARWLAAARASYAEAGLPLTFVVVNRRGWRDPRSGLARTWARVRVRPAAPATP